MLPDQNELSLSMYEVKRANQFGMEYEKIHVCPNDCIIYKKEYVNVESCPICDDSRWKRNFQGTTMKERVSAKVLWYFHPILCL